MSLTIQIFENEWLDLATLSFERNHFVLKYNTDFYFSHLDYPSHCLSHQAPLSLDTYRSPHFDFFFDLIPSGNARLHWLKKLGLEFAQEQNWELLKNGSFNPIGNIRILNKFQENENKKNHNLLFSMVDVAEKEEHFIESVEALGGFSGSAIGASGETLKFLLALPKNFDFNPNTKAVSLPNDQSDNYIVKFPRYGSTEKSQILNVELLKLEFLYLQYLHTIGVNCIQSSYLQEYENTALLWLKRFDIDKNKRFGVQSLSLLCNQPMGNLYDHFDVLSRIVNIPNTNKKEIILSYLQQDILRFYFGDIDNHLKNISLIVDKNETKISPMYDFSPMRLHFQSSLRNGRWKLFEKADRVDYFGVIKKLESDYQVNISENIMPFLNKLIELPLYEFIESHNQFKTPVRDEILNKIKRFSQNSDFKHHLIY